MRQLGVLAGTGSTDHSAMEVLESFQVGRRFKSNARNCQALGLEPPNARPGTIFVTRRQQNVAVGFLAFFSCPLSWSPSSGLGHGVDLLYGSNKECTAVQTRVESAD